MSSVERYRAIVLDDEIAPGEFSASVVDLLMAERMSPAIEDHLAVWRDIKGQKGHPAVMCAYGYIGSEQRTVAELKSWRRVTENMGTDVQKLCSIVHSGVRAWTCLIGVMGKVVMKRDTFNLDPVLAPDLGVSKGTLVPTHGDAAHDMLVPLLAGAERIAVATERWIKCLSSAPFATIEGGLRFAQDDPVELIGDASWARSTARQNSRFTFRGTPSVARFDAALDDLRTNNQNLPMWRAVQQYVISQPPSRGKLAYNCADLDRV